MTINCRQQLVMVDNTLKYLMGHGDVATTINIYTHAGLENAINDLGKIGTMKELEKLKEIDDVEYSGKVVNFADLD